MGQKIIVSSLLISTRLNWPSFWSDVKSNFAFNLIDDIHVLYWNSILIRQLGFFPGIVFLWRFNNKISLFVNNLKNPLVYDNRLISYKTPPLVKNLSLYIFKNPCFKSFNSFNILLKKQRFRFCFFAQCLCDFISLQLESSKNFFFKTNLVVNSLKLLHSCILSNSNIICGIRLQFKGKWTKTSANRKQKVIISVGQFLPNGYYSPNSYATSIAFSKFGLCSIKVWVCYKAYS